jgi:hypothetical protein
MAVKATDKLSEINLARNINTVREYLETEWPGASLIVIAVGYSSEEVRDLLSLTSSVLLFNEASFAGQLEAEVAKIAARHETAKHSSTVPNANVFALLERISSKLEDLELGRQRELTDVHERFIKSTAELSEPERKDRELKTRWEILAELDRLDDALRKNYTADEREIIRAILVANEVYLKDNLVDQIGGLYLDLISIANAADAKPHVWRETICLRTEMIGAIRRRLRRRATSPLSRLITHPVKVSLLSGILGATLVSLPRLSPSPRYWSLERFVDLLFFPILSFGLISFVFTYLILFLYNPARNWEYRVRELRRPAALEEPPDGKSK